MKTVYVLGSLNMDLVITSPKEVLQGETIHGSGFMTNGGGKGANQATACGKLGGKIVMGGAVGNDGFGQTLLNNLKNCNVNTENIRVIDGVSTGVAVILIVNHDNRIILDAGANAKVTEADVDALLKNAQEGDIFLAPLENPIDIIGYGLKKAKEKGLVTILNPAPSDLGIAKYLSYVDYFVPNEHELYDFTKLECVVKGADKLIAEGVKNVIVTLGSKGYCFYNGKKLVNEDCIKMEVVDTTAAGDTFCGAFAIKLAEGLSPEDALCFANKAAAITVTRAGAGQAIPTLEEFHQIFG